MKVSFPDKPDSTASPHRRATRGEVTEFSRRSRRRLLNTLQSLNRARCKGMPLFITLTYPDQFPQDGSIWKKHLQRFKHRMEYHFGKFSGIWKMELKDRKSGVNKGRIAPHFHLLLFIDATPQELYQAVSDHWCEAVGSGDERHRKAGTQVQAVKSWGGVISYAAKYMTKHEEMYIPDGWDPAKSPGRFWAVWNKDQLPVDIREYIVQVEDGVRMKRLLRRYAKLRPQPHFHSLTAYVSDETVQRYFRFLERSDPLRKLRIAPKRPPDYRRPKPPASLTDRLTASLRSAIGEKSADLGALFEVEDRSFDHLAALRG